MLGELRGNDVTITLTSRKETADLESSALAGDFLDEGRRVLGRIEVQVMENDGIKGARVDQPDDPRNIRSITINHRLYETIAREGGAIVPYNEEGARIQFNRNYAEEMA